jgi:hypothetical protein
MDFLMLAMKIGQHRVKARYMYGGECPFRWLFDR